VTSPERPPEPVLRIDGVSKRFDATQALDNVSLDLLLGEVHGIAGENGAGKSTLIKVMTGIYPPDTGSMALAGEEFTPHSSAEAQRHGVAAIYQEPSIFPDLSVAENIFIGHEDQGWLVDFATMYADAERLLTDLDIAVNPRLPASGLTVGGQQAVEIAKAISLDVRVLIMDEPTASLSAHEVERLFRQVRRLRQSGVAVVFITHRLEELFVIADRISVFRDGRRISTRPTSEVTEESLVTEMVGRDPSDFFSRDHQAPGDVRLEVDSLGRDGVFSDISFDLRGGEVLGFAGLVGSGRTDIGLALFGVAPATEGSIRLDGKPVAIRSPRHALELGIAYLSEDRRKLGLSMSQPVDANITLATLDRYTNGLGLLERAKERADADAMGKRLDIRAPSMATPVGLLSGGNQQKTMLAKWLNASPGVLILDEPTRGIDVGAKADVHRFIDELARSGIAIILISSDLPEVLAMSDRVAVLREGRLRAIYDRSEATEERVMTTAVGGQVG
jgi:rhamnose transport system ATP-binding protein